MLGILGARHLTTGVDFSLVPPSDRTTQAALESTYDELAKFAALVALSGRIRLREAGSRDAETVVRALYEAVFGAPDKTTDAPEADASGGA